MRLSTIATGISFLLSVGAVLSWAPQSNQPTRTYQSYCYRSESLLKSTSETMDMSSSSTGSTSADLIAMGTLASDFRIIMSSSDESAEWSLYPLGGMPAKDALSVPPSGEPIITITCQETASQVLGVEASHQDGTTGLDKDLIRTIEIALLQNFLEERSTNRETWQVSVADREGLRVCDFAEGQHGVEDLFSSLVEDISAEWVDMVTGSGKVLGRVPRSLVHKYNLLHRGIGMFVTKDKAMMEGSQATFPPLYTHQRTATKRIFPSLYDMFVGGVSLVGESSELTACREIAEELGLSRALEYPSPAVAKEMGLNPTTNPSNALSDPILDCLVCTHLNRCFVTLYSYTMDTDQETVSWQEEEVAWGDFVEYSIIAAAADLSIQRLEEQEAWPGTHPAIQSDLKGNAPTDVSYKNEDWKKWDFVPDGLLVWEAWLQYLQVNRD